MPAVLVAGAGVVGLTAAIRLREAGIAADVVARDPPQATTSAVAAALWYPYRAFPRDRVAGWSARGFEVLSALAAEPGSGVRMRWGTELVAPGAEDPWWREAVPSFARTRRGLAVRSAGRATCRCTCRGSWRAWRPSAARWRSRTLGSLDEALARAPVVVNAPGSARASSRRRRVARRPRADPRTSSSPGVDEWLLDQADPARLLRRPPRARRRARRHGPGGRRGPRRRPRDGGRDPRALRGGRARAARRARPARGGRAAPRAARRAARDRGPRGRHDRALLRPRRRRRDPRVGLRRGGHARWCAGTLG